MGSVKEVGGKCADHAFLSPANAHVPIPGKSVGLAVTHLQHNLGNQLPSQLTAFGRAPRAKFTRGLPT